jgi:hypothetical protein
VTVPAAQENAPGAGYPWAASAIAVLDPGAPSGLIRAVATPGGDRQKRVGIVWRYRDQCNHWRLEIDERACDVVVVAEGEFHLVLSRVVNDSSAPVRCLLVLDDGQRLMAYVNGEPVADEWIVDARLQEATGVGVLFDRSSSTKGTVRSFEAHPRQIKLPQVFDMGQPWLRTGSRIVIADDFSGPAGALEGRKTPQGGAYWRRLLGEGVIDLTSEGMARVRGTPQQPCPGRTAYCVNWPHPDFVDLEVTITPPGTGIGQRQMTTSGFILYQDPDNYVTLNAWRSDTYAGGSISTFFMFRGFEDIYDAVWSNVGDRISYGKPLRLRLCCDGEHYLVFIEDEPVLYRAFRDVYPDIGRLRIRKVGIVANWEFGTDTGSTFEQFKLRV